MGQGVAGVNRVHPPPQMDGAPWARVQCTNPRVQPPENRKQLSHPLCRFPLKKKKAV